MEKLLLQTERINLVDFETSDLDTLVGMRSDPEVVKYLGGEKASDRVWNKGRLDFYISCYPDGIGQRKMVWRETGEVFGWSGLQPLEGEEDIEISYGMTRKFWGKGIGSECAQAWLEFGFENVGLKRIVAVAMKENVGSWRIMEKNGMTFEKEGVFYNMNCLLYSISKDEWIAGKKV